MSDSSQSQLRLRLQINILTPILTPTPVAKKLMTPIPTLTPAAKKVTTPTPVSDSIDMNTFQQIPIGIDSKLGKAQLLNFLW